MSYLNLMEGHIKVTLISCLNKNKEKKIYIKKERLEVVRVNVI